MKHLTFLALAFNLFTHASFAQLSSNSDAPPGTLDRTFGDTGIVISDVNPGAMYDINFCNAVAVQKDQKIIAAGAGGYNDMEGFLLVRYTINGVIDSSFGLNGRVVTGIEGNGNELNNIAILDNDKILVSGNTDGEQSVALVRYNPDGTIDSTFGTDGITITKLDTQVNHHTYITTAAMALDADGKIVITGDYQSGENDTRRCYLIRYNADGTVDESFGRNGFEILVFPDLLDMHGLAVQPDGKILVGATYGLLTPTPTYFIARYLQNGAPDKNFGDNGQVTEPFTLGLDCKLFTLTLQDDGKIIAGGFGANYHKYGFGLMRFNNDGELDNSFGEKGKAITSFDDYFSEIKKILIQPDGKIIGAGTVHDNYNRQAKFALARYNPDGTADVNFGNSGSQVTDVTGETYTYSACLQEDGKIILAATTYIDIEVDFALARYIGGDGVLPITYNYINASKYNNTILLSWQTAGENNNSFFAVEHAANNSTFSEIAIVASNDNGTAQQYAYTDKTPAEGNNFYRLRQVNTDGHYSFSKTVSVYFSAGGSIKLHPNPANSEIIIEGLDAAVASTISIAGADGKTIVQKNIQSGSCIFDVRNLRAGVYFVKVQNKNQTSVLKFVKQ